MEKRIYTERDFELACVELFAKLIKTETREEERELTFGIFKTNGEPYEPATPTAPSMSDEDKVWMAAVNLYNTGMFEYKHALKEAFEMLDEFRLQQKEREGRK